ncbi:hypothetical protein [Sanguibacter suaedae]|uniref:hypothetical protein n=1 Tax=Sanguibacter suaedae TaxID=2795737 RepID=UPI003558DBB2
MTAVTYANGRKIGLSTYTDMVVRTKTVMAYQEGAFNQAEALGVEWMEIFDGAACEWTSQDDLQKDNGMIVTLASTRSAIQTADARRRPGSTSRRRRTRRSLERPRPRRSTPTRKPRAGSCGRLRPPTRRVSLDSQVALPAGARTSTSRPGSSGPRPPLGTRPSRRSECHRPSDHRGMTTHAPRPRRSRSPPRLPPPPRSPSAA